MTLDDLRVFVAVCEAQNLSAVARGLSCSQSAVSQHIKRLERELGLVLLERRPRGVVPTGAGQVLYRAAADGIAGLASAVRQLDELRRGAGGTVRIVTGATSVRHFMADAVATFRRRYPEVALEFQTESASRRCTDAVHAHRADLAWITIGAPTGQMEQRPVLELPWVLAVRRDDPLADRNAIRPADLASIRHIQLPDNSTSRLALEHHLAGHHIRLASSTSVADWDTALLLAELGLGHAIVPALPAWRRAAHDAVRLVPIPDLPPLAAGWAVRQWTALTPLAAAFAETVTVHLTADGLREKGN
jgi:DNA-binding transcriptional LysR family regulator